MDGNKKYMSQRNSFTKEPDQYDEIEDYIEFEELEPYTAYDDNADLLNDTYENKNDEWIDDDLLIDLNEYNEFDLSEDENEKRAFKYIFFEQLFGFIKIFIFAFIISIALVRFIIVNAQVPTGSMQNTILIGDRLIGFRLAYIFDNPKRGDVIIFKYPDDETQNFVKRVIGEPGDTVRIEKGIVYINDIALDEPYIREPMNANTQTLEYHIPEDCYFVMGDNRNESWDSRYWQTSHFVAKNKIIAKVLFKYFNENEKKFTFKAI